MWLFHTSSYYYIRISASNKRVSDRISLKGYNNLDIMSRRQEITEEDVDRVFFEENLNSYTLNGKQLTLELGSIAAEMVECGASPLAFTIGPKVSDFMFPYAKHL